jgi:hypothetical protein
MPAKSDEFKACDKAMSYTAINRKLVVYGTPDHIKALRAEANRLLETAGRLMAMASAIEEARR